MKWADRSIEVLKDTNAQGMIVWILEGEQYPAINYVGDRHNFMTLAPEMEYRRAVDAFFRKFRDAGLRVGLTLRPQRPYSRHQGLAAAAGEKPVSDAGGQNRIRPQPLGLDDVLHRHQQLENHIRRQLLRAPPGGVP